MPARGIGIEITETLLRAAVVERAKGATNILGFYEQPIEAGDVPWADRARAALESLRTEARLPRAPVCAGVDSGDAHIRVITLPVADPQEKLLKFEMEQHLAQLAAEDLVVDFKVLAQAEKSTTSLCAAVPKMLLAERLSALQAAGLDPIAVDLDLYAVLRVLLAAGSVPAEGRVLLMHGTDRFVKIALVQDGRFVHIRSLRFTLPQATEEAAADEAARKRTWDTKDVSGPVPLILLAKPQHAALEDLSAPTQASLSAHLAKEIQRFLLAAGGEPPEQIVLSGSLDAPRVAALLSKHARLPVEVAEPLEAFVHPFKAEAAEVARKIPAALGLALRALEPEAVVEPAMDFRREEFALARGIAPYRSALMVAFQLLFVLLAAIGARQYLNWRDYTELARQVRAHQEDVARSVLGTAYLEGEDPVVQINRLWQQRTGAQGARPPLDRSAYEVLGEFHVALATVATSAQGQGMRLDLKQIRIQVEPGGGGSLTAQAILNEERFTQILNRELQNRAIFGQRLRPTTRAQGQEVQYNVNCSLPEGGN